MKFGDKVKELRQQIDLTQEQLAKKIGVSPRTVFAYENGETYPRRREIYNSLAELFGVELNYLLTEDEEFITEAAARHGRRGELQAKDILTQTHALFAGGELSDEDQLAFFQAMQEIYFDSKARAKKFTPMKYRKDGK